MRFTTQLLAFASVIFLQSLFESNVGALASPLEIESRKTTCAAETEDCTTGIFGILAGTPCCAGLVCAGVCIPSPPTLPTLPTLPTV
ncbi:hypothetical protein GYMLUDRAFT_252337 [Collybiopsis luxurians FD-317 M1]|uniref:Hydrophobin n=1 Tax=Collybiopsis luxurians FD-317 M1 TaxID=944289 RepID=A0A0D0C0N1_9AGAR|nr:hypothetical protein GYMLUDRAFT_252337 [Collybiopsis luxurians FD-317 M1]